MEELREKVAMLLREEREKQDDGCAVVAYAGPFVADLELADRILALEPLASALRSYEKNNATYLAAKGHRIDTSQRKPTSPASKTNP